MLYYAASACQELVVEQKDVLLCPCVFMLASHLDQNVLKVRDPADCFSNISHSWIQCDAEHIADPQQEVTD